MSLKSILFKIRKAIILFLSRNTVVYKWLLEISRSNSNEKMAYLSIIKRGDTVLDIGANKGDFTVLFSNIVGSKGLVYAFEPVPITFNVLNQRVLREQYHKNIFLNNFALGDNSGNFDIHVPSGDYGQASLRLHDTGSWSNPGLEVFNCLVKTLDDFVLEKGLKKIDFIKLDVEGAELLALKGGQKVLHELHPIIHLEYFSAWTKGFGYTAKDLFDFLKSCKYNYFFKDDFSYINSTPEQLDESGISHNIICSIYDLSKV